MPKKKSKDNKKSKKAGSLKVPEFGNNHTLQEHIKIQEQIDYIIDHFKYDKVHKAMTVLEWKWLLPGKEEPGIPKISDLRGTSRYLLSKVATSPERVWSTGGFIAERYEDGSLSLLFYIDQVFDYVNED